MSVDMEMTVTRFEKDRALSILVTSLGDPGNGFTETGDYTLAEENGKTRLRFAVRLNISAFCRGCSSPSLLSQPTRNLQRTYSG